VGTGVNNDAAGYITIPTPIHVMLATAPVSNASLRHEDLLIQHTYGDLQNELPVGLDDMIPLFSGEGLRIQWRSMTRFSSYYLESQSHIGAQSLFPVKPTVWKMESEIR
jgi:hypothetical protein